MIIDITTGLRIPHFVTPEGLNHWQRLAKVLVDLGTLTSDKQTMIDFGRMCNLYAEWRRVSQILRSEGDCIRTARGNWKEHPLVKIKSQIADKLLRLENKFGCTPLARSRLGRSKKLSS